MHHFAYKTGVLHAEGVSLAAIADEVGTPFYCYSSATLERHYQVFQAAFAGSQTLICYSVKANSNQAVLMTLGQLGAGMDVVSEGELRRAIAAGIPGERIVFSGVGKTAGEMAAGLAHDIFAFNVESRGELEQLSAVAQQSGKTARVALRVNPDVDPKTHHKIATGRAEDKFGIPWSEALELYGVASQLPGLSPVGVHMHIGSQIIDLEPFERAFALLRELVQDLRGGGHDIEFINFGGGLGVPYRSDEETPPDPEAYAAIVLKAAQDLDCRLIFEPGRMIAGNAGVLVSRVLYVKSGPTKTFTIVDAGMNDLIRPTLYGAHHEIWPVAEPDAGAAVSATDVVGPVCETGDFLALERTLPELHAGDLIAVLTAGAYGAVQASSYNSRLLVPEIMVRGDAHAVIRARPSYERLIGADTLPGWLTGT
jgi:diaminopimelate decarboxylase